MSRNLTPFSPEGFGTDIRPNTMISRLDYLFNPGNSSFVFHVHGQHFTAINSTQSYLESSKLSSIARSMDSNTFSVYVCSSDEQLSGQGKGGRSWFSPGNHLNLAMSLLLPFPVSLLKYSGILTQLMSLSAARLFAEIHVATQLKWPNDVMIANFKIGGILAQMFDANDTHRAVIIGIGLNFDVPHEVLDDRIGAVRVWPAGSVKQISGKDVDIAKFRSDLVNEFLSNVAILMRDGNASMFLPDLRSRQLLLCSPIAFRVDERTLIRGIHGGISDSGGIILELPDGQTQVHYSGEIVLE